MSLGYQVLSAPYAEQSDLVVDSAHSTVIHLWSPSLLSHAIPTTLITGRLRRVCKQLPLIEHPHTLFHGLVCTDWPFIAQILSRLALRKVRRPETLLRDLRPMAGQLNTPSERHRLWQRGDGCPGARAVTSAEHQTTLGGR